MTSMAVKVYRPHEIAENIILCGFKLRERHPLMSIIIAGVGSPGLSRLTIS